MCEICGCESHGDATAVNLQTGQSIALTAEHVHADGTRHSHAHGDVHHHHGHGHEHRHAPDATTVVALETRIVAKNDALAARNRSWLAERGVVALNLMSAPGAGKTTLLERTIHALRGTTPLLVLEGDQATSNDGERIRAAGAPVIQINTGTGCHLEADMVARGLSALAPQRGAVVVIENVGNLVCPALFDLGETRRIVILSVTEGDDKPLKYPHMFRAADLVLVSKIDLLQHVDFDLARAAANLESVNPNAEILQLSARSGEGLTAWYQWLARQQLPAPDQRPLET